MIDQAAKLRELAGKLTFNQHQSPAGPRIIAITSGKGGVGKTNLVVNIAVVLAQMGKKVVVFDADMGLANAEVLLGLTPRYNLYEVIIGNKTLEEIMVQGPFNLNIISGGSGIQELADMDSAQREILLSSFSYLEGCTDFVLVDTGAGISKNVLGFVAAAQEVLVVMTPEPTSMTDAYALIKVLSKFKTHSEVGLIVNRVSSEREAIQTVNRMKTVVTKFLNIAVKNIGSVVEDQVISRAVKAQKPFVLMQPRATASQNVVDITMTIINRCEYTPNNGMVAFMSKLVRLFR